MVAEFHEAGIRFKYPENWQLEREETDNGWSISLQSPGSAFLFLCLREDQPTLEETIESALAALTEEYPGLETDISLERIGGQPTIGQDVSFFSLDLTNTCRLRSFMVPRGTVLLLCQWTDAIDDMEEQVMDAICQSMEIED